jgi:hypothetical protein
VGSGLTIAEPPTEFSLSQVELLVVPHDKKDFCAYVSFISMPQLLNNCDTFALEKYKYDDIEIIIFFTYFGLH